MRVHLFAPLVLAIAFGVTACHYDYDKSTMELDGTGGVAPLADGGFAFALYPCNDDQISRLELVILGQPQAQQKQVILRADFQPARSSRELLVSTSPSYVAPEGVTISVVDPVTLAKFNTDPDYLTTPNNIKDDFFAINAWDADGAPLPSGSSLDSRFKPVPGELVLTDSYVDTIDNVKCSNESEPAWHMPTDD